MVRFATMKPVALLLLVLTFIANAQKPEREVHARWYHTGADSVRVEYALPETSAPRPTIVVLSDRFGMQKAVQSILRIFAGQGYCAFAIPLRSTPMQAVEGIPSVSLDSTDVDNVSQVIVDILNEPLSNGKAGLFAFDIGATIGSIVAGRFPLFKSIALFYPAIADLMEHHLQLIRAPVILNIADYDPDFNMGRVNALREALVESGCKVEVMLHRDCGPFFFNPAHRNFNKNGTNVSWNAAMKLFFSTLQ